MFMFLSRIVHVFDVRARLNMLLLQNHRHTLRTYSYS